MAERVEKTPDVVEVATGLEYKPIIVHTKTIPVATLDPSIQIRIGCINDVIAIKGGFARELFRFCLGLTPICDREKLQDLDVVVFETPSENRNERIDRRKQIASLPGNLEPKDIEICQSIPQGLAHFFRTRDVTMNEVVVFREEDALRFLYSEECLEDLENRVIRPAVHCGNTGLEVVWTEKDGKRILLPSLVGRCIYRKVKGDGDTFYSDDIDFAASVENLNADALFKIIKRFSKVTDLFEACIDVFRELAITDERISQVRDMVSNPSISKSRGTITAEVVEEILEERAKEYESWVKNADASQKGYAAVLFR